MELIEREAARPQNRHLRHDSDAQRKRATKHGYYHEAWYGTYKTMMQRCYMSSAGSYIYYGARGISVCEEWHDIEQFKAWVESSGYQPGLSLDRIDSNGDYCPDNCRWATAREQANNRRTNVPFVIRGEKRTLAELAEQFGINRHTLWDRVHRRGWSLDRALYTPPKHGARMDGGDGHEAD